MVLGQSPAPSFSIMTRGIAGSQVTLCGEWFLVPHLPHVPVGKEKSFLSLFSFCDAFCVFESAR